MSAIPKVQFLNAAIELASYGAQKAVVACYYPGVKSISQHFVDDPRGPEYKHRDGDAWLRVSSPLAYTADRLFRLYNKMFSDNLEFCSRKFGILELHELFFTYKMLHPSDVMSVNRVHYWVQAMRSQSIFAAPKCTSCKQLFIFHPHDIKSTCSLCEAIKRESLLLSSDDSEKAHLQSCTL